MGNGQRQFDNWRPMATRLSVHLSVCLSVRTLLATVRNAFWQDYTSLSETDTRRSLLFLEGQGQRSRSGKIVENWKKAYL